MKITAITCKCKRSSFLLLQTKWSKSLENIVNHTSLRSWVSDVRPEYNWSDSVRVQSQFRFGRSEDPNLKIPKIGIKAFELYTIKNE